jgi:hypothetical protein
MALVDEFDGLLLSEVGVSDDHLLDPLGIHDTWEIFEPPQRAEPVLFARRGRDVADDLDPGS